MAARVQTGPDLGLDQTRSRLWRFQDDQGEMFKPSDSMGLESLYTQRPLKKDYQCHLLALKCLIVQSVTRRLLNRSEVDVTNK